MPKKRKSDKQETKETKETKVRRKRRTKAEMRVANKPVVEVPIIAEDEGFKLQVLDHSELRTLSSEKTGFTISVKSGGKEIGFGFDTHIERIVISVHSPKYGYPARYQFTVSQFLHLLERAKPEKRDGIQ